MNFFESKKIKKINDYIFIQSDIKISCHKNVMNWEFITFSMLFDISIIFITQNFI